MTSNHRTSPASAELRSPTNGSAYPPLDPEVADAVAAPGMQYRTAISGLSDATLADVREAISQARPAAAPGTIECTDHPVPATDGVSVRIHRAAGSTDDRLPALLWMHGGGFIFNQRAGNDARFERWCGLGVIGVSVHYRLAPETPYPGALEDCYAALDWLHQHADELGVDARRIGVGGLSAGGNLAAGTCLAARDRDKLPIAYQLLVYPALDDRRTTVSSGWPDPVWPPAANAYAWGAYLGALDGTAAVPPYAAPARATDLSDLPPALIVVGSLDLLSDEAVEYALRLRHAGNSVDLYMYAGAPHGFDRVAPTSAVALRANRDIDEWLARHLVQPGPRP